MQTRREWLAAQGLAKPGARGKFSREAQAALSKALAGGMEFSDLIAREEKANKPKREPKAEPTDTVNNFADGFMRYSQDQMFVGFDEGKRTLVNVRQGCYHGRGSIMGCQHPGNTHRVLVGHARWIDVNPIGE